MEAGSLIVTEAGGMVSDLSGETFSIHDDEILASNGKVHEQMTGILRKAGCMKGR